MSSIIAWNVPSMSLGNFFVVINAKKITTRSMEMSNFICVYCGAYILEGENGFYVTGCDHYPLSEGEKRMLEKQAQS